MPVIPWRSRNDGTCRGRPNHLSVITLNRSPSSRRITSRVHSSHGRAVRSASGTTACGRRTGYQARKNASLSVTRSSAPPEIRSTASPRQTCVSEKVSPSTSIPSQRSTSRSASSASRSGVRPAREPPAAVALLGRPQRRVGEDVLVAHVLAATERLEDRATGKLVGPVAEERPVRDLARRRPAGPDRVEHPARARGREPVEVRRVRRLVAGPAVERVVRPVAEPVEEDYDDRMHMGRRLTRAPYAVSYLAR